MVVPSSSSFDSYTGWIEHALRPERMGKPQDGKSLDP